MFFPLAHHGGVRSRKNPLVIVQSTLIRVILLLSWSTIPVDALLTTNTNTNSLLANTRWKIRLDVGLQPGTWMPKRHPGWAESGARLVVDTVVEFSSTPSQAREMLVGPKDMTSVLRVSSSSEHESVFVSEKGEQRVTFTNGGWCIQRPTNNIKNTAGDEVKPEGLLRFWLDCPTGAARRDAEIFPSTRIFFTTGVWDDPVGLEQQETEYKHNLDEMNDMLEKTRKKTDSTPQEERGNENLINKARSFQRLVGDAEEFEKLKRRKEEFERSLPPQGASQALNGVQMAPTGSLVVKGNKIPDWLPGSEYLILGTFSAIAIE